MKISFILIFALLIAGAIAHKGGEERSRRHYRRRCNEEVNDNGVEEAGEAQETDASSEIDPIPSDVSKKDSKCKGRRKHGGSHRDRGGHHKSKHEKFEHDPEWHKEHNVPMPDENKSDSSRLHHHHRHHHHRHHHHHHRHHHNCTTTTSTTTTPAPTTTTSLPGVAQSSTWSSIDTEKIDPRTDDNNNNEEINRDP